MQKVNFIVLYTTLNSNFEAQGLSKNKKETIEIDLESIINAWVIGV